jgi:MarR family transcriptional regulator, organic hydroperoxide resistance regulator
METRIAAQISDVRAKINSYLLKELHNYGINGLVPSHGAVLKHLFTHEVVTMKDLAKAVRRDKSTVTTLVAKLIAKGYVEREAGSDDQRIIHVRLTQKGEELRPVFLKISENLLRQIWKGIDDAEQKEVVRILEKIGLNF